MSIKLSEIKKDQVFYECESGINFRATALENARRDADGWHCKAIGEDGCEIDYFEAHGIERSGYALRLYDAPAYYTAPLGATP